MRPVKVVYSRKDCFIDGLNRLPCVFYIKEGVKKDGTLLAREMKMIVKLTYFKATGKYYGEGIFEALMFPLFEIWDEVRKKMDMKCLPGLIPVHSDFIVLVEVPGHIHEHPHLMFPKGAE